MTKGKGKNPGASGLDKHIKRKEHYERSQLESRKRLGQLEKHKDYVVRAKRRKLKKEKLLKIKRSAAQRNPDEFNIGMTKAVMDVASGRMMKRKNRRAKEERQSDLKQTMQNNEKNLQYLNFKSQSDLHRVNELLKEEVSSAILSTAPTNKHVIFTESEEEFKKFNPLKYFDTTKEMLKSHPAVRGSLTVMKNTVLPETMLLAGHHMKSASQRRAERKKIQKAIIAKGLTDDEEKSELVQRMKRKLRKEGRVAFSDLVEEQGGTEEEEEEVFDPVKKLKEIHAAQEKERALAAARRTREVSQRMQRSKSLSALAGIINRQNKGIKRQLDQRNENKFKPNATRRAR